MLRPESIVAPCGAEGSQFSSGNQQVRNTSVSMFLCLSAVTLVPGHLMVLSLGCSVKPDTGFVTKP